MKNREYLLWKNIYDLLLYMQKNRGVCVLEDLNQSPTYCCSKSTAEVDNCELCIQRWLNEEYQEKNIYDKKQNN